MSTDNPSAEDVTGLFRKFGGDSQNYKEFAPPEPTGADGRAAWPLLSGAPIERAAEPPPAAPAPVPVQAAPPPPVAPTIFPSPAMHAMSAMPAAGSASPADLQRPNELQALFARLAAPQRAEPAPGPMSRWRRPT
jgi:hypothetical protein